jgi:hypothetical protein
VNALLAELAARGIALTAHGDTVHVKAPPGALTPELRDQVKAHKPELMLALLEALVERLARAFPVPEHEIPIMVETARGDQESAWICFRSLAREPWARVKP